MQTNPLPSPSLAPTVRFTRSRAVPVVSSQPAAPANDAASQAAWRTTARLSGVVFAAAIVYAVVRYVLLGTVDAIHVPIYILNKAAAVSSVAMLGACLTFARGAQRKTFGIAGFVLGAVHTMMTLSIFSASYFAKFFAPDGRLALQGELIVLSGLLTLGLLVPVALTSLPGVREAMRAPQWKAIQKWAVGAFYLAGAHVVVMGVPTWLAPSRWPGGLPPITLLGAAIVLLVAVVRRVRAASPSSH